MSSGSLVAVLGAGRARRFGADKLSQPCAGKPLGRWALDAALATSHPVVWIAGSVAPAFIDPGKCEVLLNPAACEGLGTSVAMAARAAAAGDHDALLVILADMPLITSELLHRLLSEGAAIACRHADGHPGVPALLPASAYPKLQGLSGDRGAGPLLRALPELKLLEASPSELLDIDTPADLAEAERLLSGHNRRH
jgi:CTP:molybdopterin cytidylyltransferase MocA